MNELRTGLRTDGRTNQRMNSSVLHSGTVRGVAIEVNHVEAQIVEGNIPLKNGVLHIVDGVLGVPTQSAWDFIQSSSDLR